MKPFTHYEYETYHANKHRFAELEQSFDRLRQLQFEISYAEAADPITEFDFNEIADLKNTLEMVRKETDLELYMTLKAFKNAIEA